MAAGAVRGEGVYVDNSGSPVDVGIVGAGPVGLEAAIRATRAGLRARVWDRGPLAAAVAAYPTNMIFFTSNELLEIGDHPLVTGGPKATRREALDYYRKVAEREALDVVTHADVVALETAEGGFLVRGGDAAHAFATLSRTVVVATGYYGTPRRLGVPGEDLPHVSHYYLEAHPHWRRDVVIAGAGNSAAEAALELWRAGARVTMVVRGETPRSTVKYWVRPDLENRIREGSITALFGSSIERIEPDAVVVSDGRGTRRLHADTVLLLIGFVADASLAAGAGAALNGDGSLVLDPVTFETAVPGLFVVGSAGYGPRTGEVFIENGRLHARAAVAEITRRLAHL
ncbi:MAG: YpdA family putative bacillithiol disulfide reductase [Acidobacteriota bacterium]